MSTRIVFEVRLTKEGKEERSYNLILEASFVSVVVGRCIAWRLGF